MDWTALTVSLRLAAFTCLLLLPVGLWLGRTLATTRFRGKPLCEALVALPLVMPPTVLGFYLMQAFGAEAPFGGLWSRLFGSGLNFTFTGILLASLVANLPFAVQPIQRTFETVPANLREAAWCSGLSDRKSTRLNSSHVRISYAVFCLKKKKHITTPCIFPTTLLYFHITSPSTRHLPLSRHTTCLSVLYLLCTFSLDLYTLYTLLTAAI